MLKKWEISLIDFLRGKPFAFMAIALAMLLACLGGRYALATPCVESGGFVYQLPENWLPEGALRLFINLILFAANIVMMEEINRNFNLLRTSSPVFLPIFAILECATPVLTGALTSALLLNLTIMAVTATFFTVYQRGRLTRRIFLAFFVMSAMSLSNYTYAIYIIAFLPAFGQMRVTSGRMYMAALMGIITPWWLDWGFGLMPPGTPRFPDISTLFDADTPDRAHQITTIVTVGITVILCFVLCVMNMVKIYAYNAKSRSLNGLMTMISLITALAALLNFTNSLLYLSLLNCLTAFQTGLFLRGNVNRIGYILLLSLIIVYLSLFAINILL